MNKIKNILLLFIIVPFIFGCADDNESARIPVASAKINANQIEINQSFELTFTGVADQVVVYTGDIGHKYEPDKTGNNQGFVVNKNSFSYSYSTPGTYHVVCIATTYDTYMGGNLHSDSTYFDVTVIDDVTNIDKIYISTAPNTYYAQLENEMNWVLRLPEKQLYNNKEVTVNAKRQRLNFEISSDSAKIFIDNEQYSSKKYYDLTQMHNINVISNFGTSRKYLLYTMNYPEFKNVEINNVKGVLSRNAYYQDELTYTFNVSSVKDLKDIVLDFDLNDGDKFYVNDKEISSGSEIDLSNVNNRYTLIRTNNIEPMINTITKIKLVIKKQ